MSGKEEDLNRTLNTAEIHNQPTREIEPEETEKEEELEEELELERRRHQLPTRRVRFKKNSFQLESQHIQQTEHDTRVPGKR